MKPAITCLFGVAFCVVSSVGYGQTTRQPSSESQPARRITMTECEGIDNCTTWTFLSEKGYGKWRTGEEAVLEVKSVKDGRVVISRTDVTGSKAGLTATYEGSLSDGQLGGKYTYSYNGKSGSGRWYAILGTPAPSLPTVMHFCAQHCVTFTLENGQYTNYTSLQGQPPGQKRVLTVEKFTPESVILHRTDYGDYPGTAVYAGWPGDDGNSLTGNGWKLTWGAALNSIPGSDEERAGGFRPQTAQITVRDFIDFTDFLKALGWWANQLSGSR